MAETGMQWISFGASIRRHYATFIRKWMNWKWGTAVIREGKRTMGIRYVSRYNYRKMHYCARKEEGCVDSHYQILCGIRNDYGEWWMEWIQFIGGRRIFPWRSVSQAELCKSNNCILYTGNLEILSRSESSREEKPWSIERKTRNQQLYQLQAMLDKCRCRKSRRDSENLLSSLFQDVQTVFGSS